MTQAAIIRKADLKRYAEVSNKTGCQVVVKIGETVITVNPAGDKKDNPKIDYRRPVL